MGFYSEKELAEIGFKEIGKNCLISTKASIYGADKISIGNNVRIDDFCILSATKEILIDNFVHIAAFCGLYAVETIQLFEYSGLSSRVSIYSGSDDYSGEYLTNPTVPIKYRNIVKGRVVLMPHSIVGAGAVILPGVEIGIGTAVGAMSLVTKSLDSWGIYSGIPAKRIKARSKRLLDLWKLHSSE